MRATNGVSATVTPMRIGWVSFVMMYAAAKVDAFPLTLDGAQPARNATHALHRTRAKITRYSTTATAPYSAMICLSVLRMVGKDNPARRKGSPVAASFKALDRDKRTIPRIMRSRAYAI